MKHTDCGERLATVRHVSDPEHSPGFTEWNFSLFAALNTEIFQIS
jgi:hypothetical protein